MHVIRALADLRNLDREIEIIQSLAEQIVAYETAMIDACDVSAELDCLLSFAEASRAYNYVRPNMVEENVTIIRDGRYADTSTFSRFS